MKELKHEVENMSDHMFSESDVQFLLTLPALCISENCIEIKVNLNFYFHPSLWCVKRFYEGL